MDNVYIVATSNFIETIPKDEQAIIYMVAQSKITPKTDFLVFDPLSNENHPVMEDQGRTMRLPMKTIPTKVYAKLDDYGSAETLSEQVGHQVKTQYALTLMLAEDY